MSSTKKPQKLVLATPCSSEILRWWLTNSDGLDTERRDPCMMSTSTKGIELMGQNTSPLTIMYDSTGAESDMYNPSHLGRLPACDVPITNGYT
jgi:hypothetical protein